MTKKYDYTTLACLERCEQEYVERHVRGLVGTETSASAHFGQMLHGMVRVLYEQRSEAAAYDWLAEHWNIGLEAQAMLLKLRGEKGLCTCTEGGGGDDCLSLALADPKKPHLTPQRAVAMVEEYRRAWGLDRDFDVIWNEGYAESAQEAAIPDRCVRLHADHKLYAMDLKTTGMYLSPAWQESFRHSQQVAIQLDVLESVLGERVEGFILDAMHIRRSGTPLPIDFVRSAPIPYSEALRAELRAQREYSARRADDLRLFPEAAQKSPGACMRYGELCPYFALCRADPQDREDLRTLGVEKGTWKVEPWRPEERG